MNLTFVGVIATLIGCLALYLGASNQSLLRKPWHDGLSRVAGLLGLGLGLTSLIAGMQALSGVFTFVVLVMLALALLPYLGAWRSLGVPEADRRRRRA